MHLVVCLYEDYHEARSLEHKARQWKYLHRIELKIKYTIASNFIKNFHISVSKYWI
jgi:hypothetical protein